MNQFSPMRTRRRLWLRVGLVLLVLLAFGVFYVSGLHHEFDWPALRTRIDQFKDRVQDHLALAIAIYFAIYVVCTALSLPSWSALSLIGGALFGRWLGTALVSVAATMGATLAFLSSRFLFRSDVEQRFGDRLGLIRRGIERDGAWYLLTIRLIPVFPYFLVNLAMGVTRIPVRTFIWATWLGMLPTTFVFVNAGTAAATIESPGDVFSPDVLLALSMLGLIPLLLRLIVNRIRGRRVETQPISRDN